MEKLVIGKNMVKSFGEGVEKHNVLDGVSVEIEEGEFVAVMGPSGSGKSTLLFAISGMDEIDSGAIFFDGKDLSSIQEKKLADLRRTQMGFIFQQPTMLKNLNILDNIILPSMRDNRKKAGMVTAQAKSLMKKTGIEELETRDITQVSGGQLQRAGICRALLNNPKIIFGDEPTGALNSKSAEEVMEILAGINAEGTAVMLVTHDARVAARANRILFMCDGKIISEMLLGKLTAAAMEQRLTQVMEKMRAIGV